MIYASERADILHLYIPIGCHFIDGNGVFRIIGFVRWSSIDVCLWECAFVCLIL